MICKFCNRRIADDSIFCAYCGEQLKPLPGQNTMSNREVVFADINLRSVLMNRFDADMNNDGVITKKELATLSKIELMGGDKVARLDGLEYAVGLKEIIIRSCFGVQDISALAKLKNLEHVWICNTNVRDLSPLAELENLRVLELRSNQIDDIRPLAKLKKLTLLDLSDNHVQDISAIAEMQELRDFAIRDNKVRDISVLAGLPNISDVDLSNNEIEDLSVFDRMEHPEHITLKAKGNPLKNVPQAHLCELKL